MSQASSFEWQMLGFINQERISRGLDPLVLDLRLNESSEIHSQWMLATDIFSHTGSGGSSAGARMADAGFVFSGSWGWGENIALQSERGAPGIADDVEDLHIGLMNSSGHRANILDPDFEAIGIGIETGDYNSFDAVVVTQNFAYSASPYQPDDSGGSSGDAPATPPNGTGGNDILSLSVEGILKGYAGDDELTGSGGGDTLMGGWGDDRLLGQGGNDSINGGAGNDTIYGGNGQDVIHGKSNNDLILGGNSSDDISMGWGDDVGYGGDGNDVIRGSGGADHLFGENGNDTLLGGKGFDLVYGGAGDDLLKGWDGRDVLDGGADNDTLNGGAQGDTFIFREGHDVVTDFDALSSFERIDLSRTAAIRDYQDLMNNHVYDFWGHAVIDDLEGNTMRLKHVSLIDLDPDDFIF